MLIYLLMGLLFLVTLIASSNEKGIVVKHDTVDMDKNLTLLDLMDGVDGDGNEIHIVEALTENMPLMQILPWKEANGYASHMTGSRVKRAKALRQRRLHRGSTTWHTVGDARKETIDDYEDIISVDTQELKRAPNAAIKRVAEIKAHTDNMAEQMSVISWYGSRFDSENDIIGFANRYNDLSMANVKGAGGTSNSLSSIWLFVPDVEELCYLYPKAHPTMGVREEDMAVNKTIDPDGGVYFTADTLVGLTFGINSSNPDRIARLCNLEVREEEDLGTDAFDFLDINQTRRLIAMKNKLKGKGAGAYLICSPEIKTQMDIWAAEKAGGFLVRRDPKTNVDMTHFLDIPVMQDDTILNTEEQVS